MLGRSARIGEFGFVGLMMIAGVLMMTSCRMREAAHAGSASMPGLQPEGYLALPPVGRTQRGAVLVLHPWWGLNEVVKNFCERLADEGFVVFAPDLYQGKVVTTIAEAEAMVRTVEADPEKVKREVRQAAAWLRERAGDAARDGVSVIGLSMGAYFALDLSIAEPALVHSVVVFYGSSPDGSDRFRQARARYLGHFAERDPYEPAENVDHLKGALRDAGPAASFHLFPGTSHWFFESDRPEYNAAAADLAWERTLEFLTNNDSTH